MLSTKHEAPITSTTTAATTTRTVSSSSTSSTIPATLPSRIGAPTVNPGDSISAGMVGALQREVNEARQAVADAQFRLAALGRNPDRGKEAAAKQLLDTQKATLERKQLALIKLTATSTTTTTPTSVMNNGKEEESTDSDTSSVSTVIIVVVVAMVVVAGLLITVIVLLRHIRARQIQEKEDDAELDTINNFMNQDETRFVGVVSGKTVPSHRDTFLDAIMGTESSWDTSAAHRGPPLNTRNKQTTMNPT